jgi:hypothetical protein
MAHQIPRRQKPGWQQVPRRVPPRARPQAGGKDRGSPGSARRPGKRG